MTTVAIIIARAGSKRLPGKNIKEFCGRPLIAWSIIQARACEKVAEVYVSTDSEEIADISRAYGATVLMREDPRESLDITGGGVPLNFAALRIEKMRDVDAVLTLFPTSPLRKTNDFNRLIQAYEETGKDHGLYIEIKDAFIYIKLDYHTTRQFLMDKAGNFLYAIGGSDIVGIDYYHTEHAGPNTFVDWNNPVTWAETPVGMQNSYALYYLLAEGWQIHEIDYQSDFDICEFLFKKYLLDDWEAIYERLYEGK